MYGYADDHAKERAKDDLRFFDFRPSVATRPRSSAAGTTESPSATSRGAALLEFLATPEAAAVWVQRPGFTEIPSRPYQGHGIDTARTGAGVRCGLALLGAACGGESDAVAPTTTLDIYSRNNRTGVEIYVMSSDGSGQTRLTGSPAFDAGPSWSSDGKRITFVSERGGEARQCSMNADGTNQVQTVAALPDSAKEKAYGSTQS